MTVRALVTGASGYIGGRLVPELLDAGFTVRAGARQVIQLRDAPWADRVEVAHADVLDPDVIRAALEGVDVAYYLVHAIGEGHDFEEMDRRAARTFAAAARDAGVSRIVYLSGLVPEDEELSPHLRSRQEVGEILLASGVPTAVLQAAVIIGSGGASFEMLRYLTEVLPVMITPTWVRTRCQPIAIRDVLHYLVEVLGDTEPVDRVLDIGGPDVLTYQEMMQTFAEEAGLRRRVILPVPVLSPSLSSLWVGLVTPLPSRIARPLIDSLRHEVVMSDHRIDEIVPHQPIGLREAIDLALRRTRTEAVLTRWTDAGFSPADAIPGDPEWSGGSALADHQCVETTADPDDLYEAFARIGGDNGYYVADWAWRVRGWIDSAVGGPGLRRGRRHPVDLRPGEAVDFWRVRSVTRGKELGLEAEMRVPGRAWLSWRIEESDEPGRVQLHQEALFTPRGLWGRAYWYAMFPFHWVIFAGMARAIAHHAEGQYRADGVIEG